MSNLPLHTEVSGNIWFARKLGIFSKDPKESLKQSLEYWMTHRKELNEESNEYFKKMGVNNATL